MKFLKNIFAKREHPYYRHVFHGEYTDDYERALRAVMMKQSTWRRDRFYNLLTLLKTTEKVRGGGR